ncbi:hypothetical protein GGQ73_000539 [Rhizobium skierniewicense]|uniref:Transposase n=1 Tax=Rhizobium skierniewicense TaxID=984260 RepID=A0A7W6G1K2_9HYPH|nr:hypothetical protein [Rhizobium skierniewicense]
MSNTLVLAENIIDLPLPPKRPALNPLENLLHFIGEGWL